MSRLWTALAFVALLIVSGAARAEERWLTLPEPAPMPKAEESGYALVNAFASYKANDNLNLDFRVDNIFDVKYANPLNATTTSTIYEPGVTFKLGATMRFGG